MNKSKLIILLLLFPALLRAQSTNPGYDEALARKLGADEYGMKQYVLVMLKTGTNQTTEKVVLDSLFSGHMKNIRRMVDEGKLIVAGPLGKNEKTYRGIFIFDVKTLDEARELLQTDPAVSSKVLDADLFEWYGSAALPEYLPYSEKVSKKSY